MNVWRLFGGLPFKSVFCAGLLCSVALPVYAQSFGFSISVDGEHVAGDRRAPEEPRRTDVALANADIQVKFDGLGVRPSFNAYPSDLRTAFAPGEPIEFLVTANYPQWIERAEILIFESGRSVPVAVLPARVNGRTAWRMPFEGASEYMFTARVYDGSGRYDETGIEVLHRVGSASGTQSPKIEPNAIESDRTMRRGISVFGGAVTVNGSGLPAKSQVKVFGETVPVDENGAFLVQRLLPPGDHIVDVAVREPQGQAMVFNRAVNIPNDEWFYVAIADLTVGTRWGDGKLLDASPEEFDAVYMKGRTAFYLKGKIRGDYLLTAAADSGEGPLDEMYSGALTHDPQGVLRRIDPNDYYPVYGDDSELVDDAPTRGKFYVRLERGPSNVMWGRFRTEMGDGSLLRTNRVLYGASAHYETDAVNSAGRAYASASGYAALPGTLPERNVFRGTGGSAYVLRRQDVAIGSETISVELRDATTDMLISTRRLRPGVDYTINYIQGLVILNQPIGSGLSSGGAVQGDRQDTINLVVEYEYTPTDARVEDVALGGEAHVWLGDHVKVGVVGLAEQGPTANSEIAGANLRIEATGETYLEAEILASRGSATRPWSSTDGGFTFVQGANTGGTEPAYGYRVHAQAALGDTGLPMRGIIGATVEARQAGFSTPGHQTLQEQLTARLFAEVDVTDALALEAQVRHLEEASGKSRQDAMLEVTYRLTEAFEVSVGARYLDQLLPSGQPEDNGRRADVGARAKYRITDDLALFAFAQGTVWQEGSIRRNDRYGAGGEWRFGDHWSALAEVSEGTTGIAGSAMLSHQPSPDERTYVGFRMSPHTKVDDYLATAKPVEGIVLGTERRMGEAMSVRAETVYDLLSSRPSESAIYGITLNPDSRWTVNGLVETGRIYDEHSTDFDRNALSLATSYRDDGVKWSGKGEVRLENSADGTRSRQTYLAETGLNWQTSDDWRLLADVGVLISNSDQSSILDGDYIRASLGMAYRPAEHDRLNALFRYSYLYDLPAPEQLARSNGAVLGPAQRSHVMSVDANYDINEYITVGAKYGVRIGEISESRAVEDFVASTVHLGVLRGDLQVIPDWFVLVEGRILYQPDTEMTDLGALAMVSRDLGDNMRVGVGYNFGRFSDDLKDVSFDDEGIFLNVTAKY